MNKNRTNKKAANAPDSVVALDLGRRSIKAVYMRRDRGGDCTLDAVELIPVTVESSQAAALLEFALKKLKGTLLRKTRNLTVAIGAQECRITLRELPAADPADLRKVIRKASEQFLAETSDPVAFDCSWIGAAPEAPAAPAKKRQALITTIPQELSRKLQQIAAKEGCNITALTVSQVSIMETIASSCGAHNCAVGILDIGHETSTLSILCNGETSFVRAAFQTTNIFAGRNSTIDLDQLSSEQLEECFSAQIASLAAELRPSLDFFEQSFGFYPDFIYLTGGCGNHPGILNLLEREIGFQIKKFDLASQIKIGNEAVELIEKKAGGFVAAISDASRVLKARGGLDLLAEQKELLSEQNVKPLRRVYALCAVLAASVVGWGGFQHARVGQLETFLKEVQHSAQELRPVAQEGMTTSTKVAETKDLLNSILRQVNGRFLYAPVLGAMQEVPMENVELTKLKIQEDLLETAVSRSYTNQNKKVVAAQPARFIRRNTVVLEAKQSSTTPIQFLLASIKAQEWFRSSLRPVDPVLLKEIISQNVDGAKESVLKVEAYAERDL